MPQQRRKNAFIFACHKWPIWAPTFVCQLRVTMTVSLLTEHASATAEECFHLCQHVTHVNHATHIGQLRVTMTVSLLTEHVSATTEECFHLCHHATHGQAGYHGYPHRPGQSNYDSKSPHRTCLSNGGRMLSSLPAGQA